MTNSELTPMMRQYTAFKQKHQDAVLLFRMGDFYETFFEDAKTMARVLGLALTSRGKGPESVPLAGFPHHAADTYIKRLIEAGHRVAVCDQVQDPREATGLVERDVTRIITAGTLTEEDILDRGVAGQHISTVDIHGTTAANRMPARTPVGYAAILFCFDLVQSIQDSHPAFPLQLVICQVRFFIDIGIEALNA